MIEAGGPPPPPRDAAIAFGSWEPGYWDRWTADTPQARREVYLAHPFHTLETNLQRTLAIEHWYYGWGTSAPYEYWESEFNVQRAKACIERGCIPLATWEPRDWQFPQDQQPGDLADVLDKIVAGTWDRYLHAEAARMKSVPGEVIVRWAHEMNHPVTYPWAMGILENTPAKYVAAWRYLVELFRADGASNVQWFWCPNVPGDNPGNTPTNPSFSQIYPGDAWVDYVGFDAYNWVSPTYEAPFIVYEWPMVQLVRGQYNGITTTRPVMVGETGTAGSQAQRIQWINDLTSTLADPLFEQMTGLVWFNENWAVDFNFRLDFSPDVLAQARVTFNTPPMSAPRRDGPRYAALTG